MRRGGGDYMAVIEWQDGGTTIQLRGSPHFPSGETLA